MDCIHLTGIRAYGYTGHIPAEQILGQWFNVELDLWLDLSLAGSSDQLSDTLDYCGVIARVTHHIQTAKFALIERLATAIVEDLLTLEQMAKVQIRLTKLTPPIPNFAGQVTIELLRVRP
jgi:7,8-dihydroneopterin aldolase/epimerase/oxygenase